MLTPQTKASLEQKFASSRNTTNKTKTPTDYDHFPSSYPSNNEDDDVIVADDDDDDSNPLENNGWGFVSDDDDDCIGNDDDDDEHHYGDSNDRERRSGVLILAGDEDSDVSTRSDDDVDVDDLNEAGDADDINQNRSNSSNNLRMYRTATNLSFPGTDDSLPTEIHSIDNNEDNPIDNDDDIISSIGAYDSFPSSSRKSSQHLIIMMPFLIVVTICTTMLSSYLVIDRYSSKTSVSHLETELNQLRDELQLISKARSITNDGAVDDKVGASNDFNWEDEHSMGNKKFVIADNCWLHADVSFTAGSCSATAKERVFKTWNDMRSVVSTFKISGNATSSSSRQYIQTAGITLDNLYDLSSSISYVGKKFSKTMKSFISYSIDDPYVGYVLNTTKYFIKDATVASQYYND